MPEESKVEVKSSIEMTNAGNLESREVVLPRRNPSMYKSVADNPHSHPTEAVERAYIDMLQHAVDDAGRWSYGTVAVEVWVLSADKTKLVLAKGGSWVDYLFNPVDPEALERLTDKNRNDYVTPTDLSPGESLAGAIWQEASVKGKSNLNATQKVYRRDVKSLNDDPFQAYSPRRQLLEQAGFGHVAGVPFDVSGKQGIVLYLSRKTANLIKGRSPNNQLYLITAATHIGSVIALRSQLLKCVDERHEEGKAAWKRVINRILLGQKLGHTNHTQESSSALEVQPEQSRTRACDFPRTVWKSLKLRLTMIPKKAFDNPMQLPPPTPIDQSIWMLVGMFLTVLAVNTLNDHLSTQFPMPPTAAFCCLLYALTAGPPSQPRNALFGYFISSSIGLIISHIPSLTGSSNAKWRNSLSSSIATFSMSRLGLIHPPGVAGSIIYNNGSQSWKTLLSDMLGYVVAILIAIVINNLNPKKRYPSYWFGFGYTCHEAKSNDNDNSQKDK